MRHEQVWAAAGSSDSVFPISPDELLQAAGARLARFAAR
jgi:prolyl-tRNA editing enzyme YbaK/EbsC (Cys-tRNA(Pro) deacylase)